MSTDPAEKWKAKARELCVELGLRDVQGDITRLDISIAAAALAEAYEAGCNSKVWPPKDEPAPPIDSTRWNLHHD